MTPVLEQTLGVGRDLPVIGVWKVAPLIDVEPEFVDDGRGEVVLLLLSREALAFVQSQRPLLCRSLAFPRLRNRSDEFGLAAALDNPLRGLAGAIKFPVAGRVLVRRIENRPLEELVIHRPLSVSDEISFSSRVDSDHTRLRIWRSHSDGSRIFRE